MIDGELRGVAMRFPPELLARVDEWKEAQGQGLSRHLAILLLIERGLGARGDIEARIEAEVQRRLRPMVRQRVSRFKEEVRVALETGQGNLKSALNDVLGHPSG